jgi:hypothetical protein
MISLSVPKNESHKDKLNEIFLRIKPACSLMLLGYSGQSSWLQNLGFRVRVLVQPDFPSRSGSGTGSTQSREDNLGAT